MKIVGIIFLILAIAGLLTYWRLEKLRTGEKVIEATYKSDIPASIAFGESFDPTVSNVLRFPDFSMQYRGYTTLRLKQNKNIEITHYHFQIFDSSYTMHEVVWSSGTGLVVPVKFEVFHKQYTITAGRESGTFVVDNKS